MCLQALSHPRLCDSLLVTLAVVMHQTNRNMLKAQEDLTWQLFSLSYTSNILYRQLVLLHLLKRIKQLFRRIVLLVFFGRGGASLSINMYKYCIDLTRMKFWLDRLKAKHERLITNTRFSKPQRFKCMLPSCESVAHLQTVNQVYKGCWPTEGILFFISPLLSSNNTDYFSLYLIL